MPSREGTIVITDSGGPPTGVIDRNSPLATVGTLFLSTTCALTSTPVNNGNWMEMSRSVTTTGTIVGPPKADPAGARTCSIILNVYFPGGTFWNSNAPSEVNL